MNAILLDIEGTTTPIAFVYDVLFPFARSHLREYVDDPRNRDALAEPLRRLNEEYEAEQDPALAARRLEASKLQARGESSQRDAVLQRDGLVEYVEWLMDRDRKSPGLKLLQGQIWERGYRTGELRGQVFADVPEALHRWHDAGLTVAIYSSGSELAQRLLFGSTASGDLTPLIARFFDTSVGPKTSPGSYSTIAAQLDRRARDVLFVSDVTTELNAASDAGMQTCLTVRPGNHPQPPHPHPVVESFDDIR